MIGRLAASLEAERDRWILWVPVAIGAGIAVYFGLAAEPPRWAGILVLVACGAAGLAVSAPGWRVLVIAVGLVALGFQAAVERSVAVAGPILAEPTGTVALSGRIAEIEPQEDGQRIVLDHLSINGALVVPDRVRLHLAAAIELRAGGRIALDAALFPPPSPAAPGAFDFARQAWFARIGAVGYALSTPRQLDRDDGASWWERCRLAHGDLRHRLTMRIVGAIDKAGLPPGIGAVAAALITAERGPVAPETLQAFRDAGLAHILVIAGMHLSMVAGLVFVGLRAALAAIPPLALRLDIKKVTAAGALAVTFCYLVVSGGPVPTQRAFIMNAIVLLALLCDREAISPRSITWAAIFVLLREPEALLGASFQLSFAAVYGLIAAYEAIGPKMVVWRRRLGGVVLYVGGILLTTQVAGTATAFYTAFHFDRFATYGLLGNLLAVPLVGFWVMPSALLAFLLMPFGCDGFGWRLMGLGLLKVSAIAHWVAGLPGATADLPAIPVSALVVFTAGGLWLCLWRTGWRLFGLIGMAAAVAVWMHARPPDLLVDGAGRLIAVRDDRGRLALSSSRAARHSREAWLRQAGQGDEVRLWRDEPPSLISCDATFCRYHRRGWTVAILRTAAAACPAADLIVAPAADHLACPGRGIDGADVARFGTIAVWLGEAKGLRIETVADWQGRRPWSRPVPLIGGNY